MCYHVRNFEIETNVSGMLLGDISNVQAYQLQIQALATYWCDRVEHLLRACERDRALLPSAQSIDVPFDQFMADDVAMVERIYQKAGLDMNALARSDLNTYMSTLFEFAEAVEQGDGRGAGDAVVVDEFVVKAGGGVAGEVHEVRSER